MKLSGKQREKLQNALIDAFPDKSSLEQMLSFGLDINLDSIAGGSNLQNIVFNLIKRAEAENWIENLIKVAHNSNSGNQLLKNIAEELFENHDQEVPSASSINTQVIKNTQQNYQDFQILVDNNNIRASFSSSGDESGELHLDMNEINLALQLIESQQTNSNLFKTLGTKLYQALFPNQINQTTRNAISMEVGLDKRDFATPVLYMRAKDGIILDVDAKKNL